MIEPLAPPNRMNWHEVNNSSRALAKAIVSFLDYFSIEATPHTVEEVSSYPDYPPTRASRCTWSVSSGFDAQGVIEWESTLMAEGIGLPIHVGMIGRASVKQLLRYAHRCGVVVSTRMLVRGPRGMAAQVKTTIADELVLAFSNHRLLHQVCAIVRAQFFAFGGAEHTVRECESDGSKSV